MKVTPGNQTLILASEAGPAGLPSRALSTLVGSTGGDSVLQRLTMVASRPDSTMVYVRADYAPAGRTSPTPARTDDTPPAQAGDTPGNDIVAARQSHSLSLARLDPSAPRADPYGSNRGIGLYESTQRMSLGAVTAVHVHVDVRA